MQVSSSRPLTQRPPIFLDPEPRLAGWHCSLTLTLPGNTAKAHTTAPQSVEPAHVLQSPRELRHHKFSTGIGGRGNIVMAQKATHYADADGRLARLLQEELRAPRTVLPERRYHTGIGMDFPLHLEGVS